MWQSKTPWKGAKLMEGVRAWLGAFGMQQYVAVFRDKGYDDLQVIEELSEKVGWKPIYVHLVSHITYHITHHTSHIRHHTPGPGLPRG